MKNTHTEHLSTDRTPTVLSAFAELLPPLPEEQLSLLEADIQQNGCYSPIIVNEDMVVIDGHNRLSICEKHGIPYRMAVFSFEDDLEAKQWALDTQKGRRNLEKWELGKIALKLKPDIEARARANMSAGGGDQKSAEAKSGFPKSENPIRNKVNTTKELAKSVGIGSDTMNKVIQIDEHAPAPVKEALDKKEISINQGYNITKELEDIVDEEKEQAAMEAVQREVENKMASKRREINARTAIAKRYASAFEHGILMDVSEENTATWVEQCGITYESLDRCIEEARIISDRFLAIADFLENKLKPNHWRNTVKIGTEEAVNG